MDNACTCQSTVLPIEHGCVASLTGNMVCTLSNHVLRLGWKRITLKIRDIFHGTQTLVRPAVFRSVANELFHVVARNVWIGGLTAVHVSVARYIVAVNCGHIEQKNRRLSGCQCVAGTTTLHQPYCQPYVSEAMIQHSDKEQRHRPLPDCVNEKFEDGL